MLLNPQTDPKEKLTINELESLKKKKKRNVPMKHQKVIITVLPVMALFLLAERNKEAMTIFTRNLEK